MKKQKISNEAKKFVKRKSGKTIRVHALELNLPIKDYKRVVNRTLNKRVQDNTRLYEEDLRGIIEFIDSVIEVRNRILGSNKIRRAGSTIDPYTYKELSRFMGRKPSPKKELDGSKKLDDKKKYKGNITGKSVWSVKYRTNRTQ